MYWQDEKEEESVPIPEDVVDLTFRIRCASLPVDHAYALYEALAPLIPWLAHETGAGIHPIHVAESAHGWMRPEKPNDLLHLAHRTRLVLRLPATRLEDARNLTGHTVMVAGHELRIYKADVRPLSAGTSLFARRVVIREDEEEQEFVHRMYAELQETGIYAKKLSHAVRYYSSPSFECGRDERNRIFIVATNRPWPIPVSWLRHFYPAKTDGVDES
jgi:CRISPR-associated protein Cas6